MPGNYDHFDVRADCPVCGCELVERYGVLRLDPRLTCECGTRFAVYLAGCPLEQADLSWDRREGVANDNDAVRYLVQSSGPFTPAGEGSSA